MLLCVSPVAVPDCCAAPSARGRAVEFSAILLEAIAVLSVAGSWANGDGLFFVMRDVALVLVLVLVPVLMLVLVLVLASRLFISIPSARRCAGAEESRLRARSGDGTGRTWRGPSDSIIGGDEEGCMSGEESRRGGKEREGEREGRKEVKSQQVKRSRGQEAKPSGQERAAATML